MRRFLTLPSGLKRSDTSSASLGSLSRSLQTFDPVSFGLELSDEQQQHVQHLQTRLNSLYEELDQLLIQEEQLVSRGYARRKARLKLDSNTAPQLSRRSSIHGRLEHINSDQQSVTTIGHTSNAHCTRFHDNQPFYDRRNDHRHLNGNTSDHPCDCEHALATETTSGCDSAPITHTSNSIQISSTHPLRNCASSCSLNSSQSSEAIHNDSSTSECDGKQPEAEAVDVSLHPLSNSLPDLLEPTLIRNRRPLTSTLDTNESCLPVATVRPLHNTNRDQLASKRINHDLFDSDSEWNDLPDTPPVHVIQSVQSSEAKSAQSRLDANMHFDSKDPLHHHDLLNSPTLNSDKRADNANEHGEVDEPNNGADNGSKSNGKLRAKNAEIEMLERMLNDQKLNCNKYQHQKNDLELQLKDSEQQRYQLQRELRRTRLALDNSEQQKQKLVTQLQSTSVNTMQLQQQCDTLKQELIAQQNELDRLKQSLAHCEQARSELHAQSEQFRFELSSERDKFIKFLVEESRNSEQQLQKQVEQKTAQAAQLRQQLNEARAEANSLQQRFGGRTAQLQMQNATLIEQLAELRQLVGQRLQHEVKLDQQRQISLKAMDSDLSDSARNLMHGVERMQQVLVDAQRRSDHDDQGRVAQQQFLQQLERLVMRNMRSLIDQQLDARFERLEQSLASAKFDVIEGALKQDARINGQGGVAGSAWAKWVMSADLNNNAHDLPQSTSQLKVVQKKMLELRKSVETYLRSYFVRIMMELQEQSVPTSKSKTRA